MLLLSDTVLAKFGSLKTIFKRELGKLRITKSGSGTANVQPKWELFDLLAFLLDTVALGPTSSNLDHLTPPSIQSQSAPVEYTSGPMHTSTQEQVQMNSSHTLCSTVQYILDYQFYLLLNYII